MLLNTRRAAAVKAYPQTAGFSDGRIAVAAFGQDKPVVILEGCS